MLRLSYRSVSLPFQYPFAIAKGIKTHQPSLHVSLGFGPLTGYGEAPAIAYYGVTVEGMIASLEKVRPLIERYSLTDPLRFWHFLHHLLPGQHFLIAALDIAGWDLFAKLRRQPLHAALGLAWRPLLSDYTIGIDSPGEIIKKVQAHPWPVYKMKVDSSGSLDSLAALRSLTDAPVRIDANESMDYETTLRLLPEWTKLGVVLIEQPLHRDSVEETTALQAQTSIPLFADEACRTEADVARCAGVYSGIVIKLTKCGGITPALRMAAEARKSGLCVMLGNMNESSIGTAALAHLCAAADHLDADGPLLLAEDVATGLRYVDGMPVVAPVAGLGVDLTPGPSPQSGEGRHSPRPE